MVIHMTTVCSMMQRSGVRIKRGKKILFKNVINKKRHAVSSSNKSKIILINYDKLAKSVSHLDLVLRFVLELI